MKALLCILGISFALCGCHKHDGKDGMKKGSHMSSDKMKKQKRVRPAAQKNM